MDDLNVKPRSLQAAAPAVLQCRIRHKAEANGKEASPTAGEVQLENTSGKALEIEWQMSPLQYLDLIVTDAEGRVISGWHYGDCFSPHSGPRTMRLPPGEVYTECVSLLGNVPPEKRLPGGYTVQAVYEYKDVRAVSESIRVQLA